MARNWIKIETATPDKPEVCVIATFLKIDPDAALGKLIRLWAWADVNKINGNAVGVTRGFIDKVVGQRGFSDALEHAGWLSGNDGELVFTKFSKHNGKAARGRAQTAERVSRHRDKKQKTNDIIVTNDTAVSEISVTSGKADDKVEDNVNDVNSIDNALISNELQVCEVADKLSAAVSTEPVEESAELQEPTSNEVTLLDELKPAESEEDDSETALTGPDPAVSEGSEKGRKKGASPVVIRKVNVADSPDQSLLLLE